MPAELFAIAGARTAPPSQLESGHEPTPANTPALTQEPHEAMSAAASTRKRSPVADSPSLLQLSGVDTRGLALSDVSPGQPSPAVFRCEVAPGAPTPMMTTGASSPPAVAQSEAGVATPMGKANVAPRRLSFPSTAARHSTPGLASAARGLESSLLRPRRPSAQSGLEPQHSPVGAELETSE